MSRRLDQRLAAARPLPLALFAVAAAFSTYFAMYAFRKPFAVGAFAGETFGPIDLKGALIIGQLAGYALSKLAGIKFNSEMPAGRRRLALLLLIGWAEGSLILFAFLPPAGQVAALFANGLSLGAVWGLVFSFLEGRQTSEILGAGLSASYIVASGAVKSVGAALLARGVSEDAMPAVTGALFAPLFVLSVWLLAKVPPPSAADVAARTERQPMDRAARRRFAWAHLPGLLALVLVYLCLTSYRDFRDNFQADIFRELGEATAALFTATELPIALSVVAILSLLYLVRDNRWGLRLTYAIMMSGAALVGISTFLFDAGAISGVEWMTLVGLGLYLGYVPYGCVLFDRTIAALGTVATAVFLIYLSDAVAYGGSVAIVLYKMLGQAERSYLEFFRAFSYITSISCCALLAVAFVYFERKARRQPPRQT